MQPELIESEDEDEVEKSAPLMAGNGTKKSNPRIQDGEECEEDEVCEEDEGEEKEEEKTCSEKFRDWLHSVFFLVYCSHLLSTWGDRMWQFAVGLFLVSLTKDSLQLTAIYGFSSGGCVLLFGAVIGDWVDRNPRLKVARTTLIIQNLSIMICAIVLCLMLIYPVAMVTVWDGWLNNICQILVIVFADIAILASTGHKIAIERDWVVEICERKTTTMTRMTAVLRRIDLTTNILAPVGVGQIFTFGSLFIGAIFIAAWNLVSFFIEYYLLWRVYHAVPALASKSKKTGQEDENIENGELQPVVEMPDVKVPTPSKKCPDICYKIFGTFIILVKGWRCYMRQSVRFAGLGLACLYMTVLGFDNITVGYAYSQGMSESILGVMMALGAITGILGTYGFQYSKGKVGLVRTGLFSLWALVACLTLCVASIWVPGSPFDPYLDHKTLNDLDTNCTISTRNLSLYGSGPKYGLGFSADDHKDSPDLIGTNLPIVNKNSTAFSETSLNGTQGLGTSGSDLPVGACTNSTSEDRNFFSLALLMTGIITARFGLWSTDLVITQLVLESVMETERGTVNGVQSSLNMLMDMIKFVLVIIAPDPHTFGILILISFIFIVLGLICYAIYSRKVRGHLFHFHKCCGGKQARSSPVQTVEPSPVESTLV